jgi:SpoIID/LytB domain protein
VTALLAAALFSVSAPPAFAYPFPTVDFVGHGWGHGRGMGQYGAYGYAQAGQPYTWILDHYYGGTTLASVDPNTPISVHVSSFDGHDTIAQMTNAHLLVSWNGGTLGPQAAIRVVHNAGGSLSVFTGPGCAGPWALATAELMGTDVTIAPQMPGDDTAEMVQACPPDGSRHWYRGSIVAKGGIGQTWNLLALDQYVRGVVPRESPASWGTTGGEEALKAQAVAARSYGLAYAESAGVVCDTSRCQAYGGRAVLGAGGYQDLEGAGIYLTTSDAAVSATAGQVRVCNGSPGCPAGAVASTEFSSSTGGYTAGGTFPAVPDDGDATPSNPNHTWTASIPVSAVQTAFPSVGALAAVTVTQRNGLGDLGGRALQVQVSGSAGTVTLSGDQFAAAIGLRSDWFAVTNGTTGPSGGVDGYWLVGSDGGIFAFGAAPFLGSTGAMRLNRPVVGMASTPSGRGYWLVASDGGIFTFGDAGFYGSTGAMRLNQPIVGMVPTPDGRGYLLVGRDGGIFTFGDAAFEGSLPGRGVADAIAAVQPTADGRGYLMAGVSGAVYSFGDAPWFGGMAQVVPGYRGTILAVVAHQES